MINNFMKIIVVIAIASLFSSCENKSFINSTLKAENVGDCSQRTSDCKVSANTNGEEYEFEYCLKYDFDEKNYSVSRSGDTLVVSFPEPAATDNKQLYKLTLDVDANPKYAHIKLGDHVIDVSISN